MLLVTRTDNIACEESQSAEHEQWVGAAASSLSLAGVGVWIVKNGMNDAKRMQDQLDSVAFKAAASVSGSNVRERLQTKPAVKRTKRNADGSEVTAVQQQQQQQQQ